LVFFFLSCIFNFFLSSFFFFFLLFVGVQKYIGNRNDTQQPEKAVAFGVFPGTTLGNFGAKRLVCGILGMETSTCLNSGGGKQFVWLRICVCFIM
jgi:hypothetical protein